MRSLKLGHVLLAIIAFSLGLQAQMLQSPAPGEVRIFQITAQKHEFNPFTIIVRPGDKVRFVITAVDRDYAFELKRFNIHEKLKQGVPTTINFTAAEAGKFTFNCPEMECRTLYRSMKGTLVVKASAPAPHGLPPGVSQ
ncbi:MAG TPA: cupredoxin domain-containing protein [Terriglobia bacterium]|nr:cupredoxin domain-containing protein [Terriglobia bacterium]